MTALASGPVLQSLAEISAPPEVGVRGVLRLRRAWPRAAGHLLLEYADSDGARIAGQHLRDPARLAKVAAATAAGGAGRVAVLPGHGVLLQAGGADRRLSALRPLLTPPGSRLVVHRPERRAVVRLPDEWVKVVRAERVDGLRRRARALAAVEGVHVPNLRGADDDRGITRWSHVPGGALIEGLDGDSGVFQHVGAAVRRLHRAPLPAGIPRHGAQGEHDTLATWLERIAAVDPAWAAQLAARLPAVLQRFAATPGTAAVLTHGDLHDRQILISDGAVGVVDVDTVCASEPAHDLANLLAHLELRAVQGRCAPASAAHAAANLLLGYAPEPATLRRLGAYADATRLRLAAVYRLRPSQADVCAALLDRIGAPLPGC